MVANARLFWILSGFFLLADIAYTVWNVIYDAQGLATQSVSGAYALPIEWVGTIGLFLTAVLAALIAFYLRRTHRAQGAELPEDIVSANIDDGDAEQGFFSPWSWWPVVLAGCAALMFLGLAVGVWIAIIGGTIGAVALVGWTFEYHRRYFGH
ncbi:cytochrome c oxidase subunit 4 [Glaciihabitans sp. dw_435]|uniref:cytochrome c oxidase subunit 4 n=1 Tax=Glaciihabitans sp. dw_435 TaxID=2720081 RepID=UPI001BD69DDC|nr:cytochrome c oxidase subunit 4 [Glaciihabitans sp. dw_435]